MNLLLAKALFLAVAAGGSPKGAVCSLQQVMDPREGYAAFTYFVPQGWKPDTSFTWNNNSYVAQYSAETPDGLYRVTHLEPMNLNFMASTGTQTTGFRILKATDFLRSAVQTMIQKGAQNVQLLDEVNVDLPLTTLQKLQQNSRQIGGMSQNIFRQSGFLKVKFNKNGVEEVASLATTVQATNMKNDMAVGQNRFVSEQGFYVAGPSLFVTQPANPAPDKVKEGEIVASSQRMTPKFLSFCCELALQMAIASRKMTEEQLKQFRQDLIAQSDKRMADFKDKMALRDEQTRQFCNYVKDQQDYRGSNGDVLTVPTSFTNPLMDGQGHYFLNYDPLDPHSLPAGNWQPMEKVRPGQN